MYTKQSKKMLALDILEILRRYTDVNHCLSQKEIEGLLRNQYDMVVDRKSIKRNIDDLIDMGIDIQCSERTRMVYCRDTGEKEEQTVCTGFYLQRDIMDCEIQFLIDSVIDADYIAEGQKQQLVRKLEDLTSMHFKKGTGAKRIRKSRSASNQLFYTLEIIHDAMANHNMVRFLYKTYGVGSDGLTEDYEEYLVTPIDTGMCDGKYMLFCKDGDGMRRSLRIDYISEMRAIDRMGERMGRAYASPDHYEERIVDFLCEEEMVPTFVECFGIGALKVNRLDDGTIHISARVEEERALEFALRNTMGVTIMEPKSLRNRIVKTLRDGLDGYSGNSFGKAG